MAALSGLGSHTTSGYVGVAVMGASTNLAFKDFQTDATGPFQAYLTINGDLAKRKIDLGTLPAETSFEFELPAGTDISFYNTVVICTSDTSIGSAMVP